MRGSRTAIWSISRRFFSPPENPSLTYRLANNSSILRSAIFSRISRRNWPMFRPPPLTMSVGSMFGSLSTPWSLALSAERMKLATLSPGMAVGYWKARNMPSRERLSGDSLRTLRPCHVTDPPVTT